MSERTVQEIFDLAISKGFYDVNETLSGTYYMCDSLEIMHERSLLSDEEYLKVTKEIERYLFSLEEKVGKHYRCRFLYDALRRLGILSKRLSRQESWEFIASVYSDWDNRPLI